MVMVTSVSEETAAFIFRMEGISALKMYTVGKGKVVTVHN
jgi:hypothetical protein